MTPTARHCPECGAILPVDAPRGACPRCLLLRGFESLPPDERRDSHATVHLVVADEPDALPKVSEIGDYELLKEIGRGGMGVIYQARQKSLDRIVALKLIRAGTLAKAEGVARFKVEAAATARLGHPGIVAVHEVGEHDGQHFYSMDLVSGRSLAAALRDGPFAPRRAAECVRTVAEAIQYAHEQGVVHRDLKPSNVLLDTEEAPHVGDFGLAKLLESESELTLTGAALGSPNYMPPEQARGRHSEVTARSDVYSLGAILYECLTGRPPFAAPTPLETMKLVVEQEPVSPRVLNPTLPRDLETICLTCLAKEPSGRYASAQELADELGRFLADEPIHARPIDPVERAWRWCRRKPAIATLLAAGIVVPLAFVVLLLAKNAEVRHEAARAVGQEELATNALARAQASASALHQQKETTRQNLYAADITVAFDALEKNDFVVANHALSGHSPATGEDDLRGFEWRWLRQRAKGDARVSHEAHLARVLSVAWSPDGRWLASGGLDGRVQLWDAAQERLARTLTDSNAAELVAQYRETSRFSRAQVLQRYSDVTDELPHPIRVNSVSFSSDSRWLAVSKNLGIQLWDPFTGGLTSTIPVLGLVSVFSPVQSNLLAGRRYSRSTNCLFIEIPSGRVRATWNNGVDAFAFSPDGQWAAEWHRSSTFIRILHVPDGALRNECIYSGQWVEQLAFSPDGRWVAAGDKHSGDVEVFEARDGSLKARIGEQHGRNGSVAFSPDGRWLAIGNFDQTILLWDVAEKREARRLHGHRSAPLSLAFSPDSQRLASGGHDGTVRLWDVTTPLEPPAITNVTGMFAFSREGRRLLTQSGESAPYVVTLWELPSRKPLRSWPANRFSDAVFTAESEIVTATCYGTQAPPELRTYPAAWENVASPQPQATNCTQLLLEGAAAGCTSLGLSPDGRLCVTGHDDGSVAFWDTHSGRLQTLHRHAHQTLANVFYPVTRVAFSANGRTVATATEARATLITWSVAEQKEIARRVFSDIYDLVTAVSPNGRLVTVGGLAQGHTINFWDADLRESPRPLEGHQDFLLALAFSPDGRTLASGGRDGLLKLWHLPTGRELLTLFSIPHADKFGHVAFSPDGTWLGVADKKGRLRLWHGPAETAARTDFNSLPLR